jgi:formaldehyde-activating enzyme involved in methanogenesis
MVHHILRIVMVISVLCSITHVNKKKYFQYFHGVAVLSTFYIFVAHVCRITFAVAEACLIAGATKNAYHTKYRDMVYAGNWTCQTLRKGVFIAGAVFVVFTMILDVYFYMYYSKATSQATKRISKTTPSVGMTGYA